MLLALTRPKSFSIKVATPITAANTIISNEANLTDNKKLNILFNIQKMNYKITTCLVILF